LFRSKPTANCFIEVENLLATRPLSELTAADVENLLSEYVVPRNQANPRLADSYRIAVHHLAADGDLSKSDRASLSHLRYVLGIDDGLAQEAEIDVLRQIFRERLKDALVDSHLSDSEKQAL